MSQFVSVAPPSLLRSLTDELTFDEDDDDDDAGDDDEKEEFHWHKKGGREGGRGEGSLKRQNVMVTQSSFL